MIVPMVRTKLRLFQHRIRGCVTFSTEQPKVVTVGIDFGCKNLRIAIMDSLVPHVINSETGRFTPSYVTFMQLNSYVPYEWGLQHLDNVGKRVAVGEIAKRQILRQPSDVIYNIKKLIGKQFDDTVVQEMRKKVYFKIIEGPGGEALVGIHGMQFSPVDITSAIFQKLKDIVLMYQFHNELQAVISVPAFFDELQKEHIKSAARKAGLKLLRLIDETTAAALSSIATEDGIVVVFGMGAGSFSATILRVSTDTNIEVITQLSDPSVGGDQFDYAFVDFVSQQILELHSVDIRGDIYAMTMLVEAVEQAKVELSNKSEVTISIPSFSTSAQGPVDLNITLSRLEFENLVDKLIGEIKSKCQSVLEDAKISANDIKEIVLIGGMSRVPKIQRVVCEVFGQNLQMKVNPEEAVVVGSAIHAALTAEDEQEITYNMTPLSIGIESSQGIFTRVVPRSSAIPTKRTVKIPTWLAYGERKPVKVFWGEHVMVQHNVLLGEIEVIKNQSSHYGCADLELTFEVDKNFVVKVTAKYADDESSFFTFPIAKEDRSKENVDKAVKKALLDWKMSGREIHARLKNLGWHAMNTLCDVLYARKDELPDSLYKEAAQVLVDLKKSLDGDGDVDVLRACVLSAKSMESKILNWLPLSDDADSEYRDV
ncbi:unnamed protein product [Urochloa decumbens]|uniref:Uncharacterized protein n=1 Tax=Urochloa decumbens TaxID=240449 RepID=A0ABC9F7J2_9POAL